METILRIISSLRVQDIIDIALISIIIYRILLFVRKTRAEQLLKGIGLVLVFTVLSEWLKLYTVNWILSNIITLGAFAIIVIFQPELRRGLEYLGRSRLIPNNKTDSENELLDPAIYAITRACESLSKKNIGALIVIEGSTGLSEIIETGVRLDAVISEDLLCNIFFPNAPLHDGATIIRGDTIVAASTFLPLSENPNISSEMGTRHRAGIGISEKSDCLSIIVSEETGSISIAEDGELSRHLDIESLEEILKEKYTSEEEKGILGKLRDLNES